MIVCYDGTISGFFCLLGRILKENIAYSEIQKEKVSSTADLFDSTLKIVTDFQWADQVTRGIEKKLGRNFLRTLILALLSEKENIESLLVNITGQSLKHGGKYLQNPRNPGVSDLEKAAHLTRRERHRLLGLIRFVRLADDYYLAQIQPRTNVISLLGGHFSRRFSKNQKWIITDIGRKTAIWHDGTHFSLEEHFEISADLVQHATETFVTDLWKSFYRSISNPQRYNPKLRQKFIPRRYWQHVTELESDSSFKK